MVKLKTLTAFLLAMSLCLISARADSKPDFSKEGSLSNLFQFGLSFHPATEKEKAKFVVTLTNTTDRELVVQLNTKSFHGNLLITDEKKKTSKAYHKTLYRMMLTGTWSEPVTTLASKKSVTWQVPLNSLVKTLEESVTHKQLEGKIVTCEMVMAVLPEEGRFSGNNAVQKSKPITIPKP